MSKIKKNVIPQSLKDVFIGTFMLCGISMLVYTLFILVNHYFNLNNDTLYNKIIVATALCLLTYFIVGLLCVSIKNIPQFIKETKKVIHLVKYK